MNSKYKWSLVLLCLPCLLLAHEEVAIGGGFLTGFMHPIFGWDHVIAMVAVGVWGAFLGKPLVWVLPVAFPMMMTVGGVLGMIGVPLPGVEIGIALSAIVLGALIFLKTKAHSSVAIIIVGVFAIFHGHAHGTEQPDSANQILYSTGFVLSTGLLHLSGVMLGFLVHWNRGQVLVRGVGAVISVLGMLRLSGIF